jgi:GAF domain-containing protein
MLKAISERLSQAMESARLFDEVRVRAERERLISDITAKIRTSTNVDIILQTAVQELSKALHISKGAIQLKSGNGGASNE